MFSSNRTFFSALIVFCTFLFAGSLTLQFGFGLTPCLLCIVDRILVILLIILYSIAWCHNPRWFGARIYFATGFLLACLGILVTSHHLWLIHFPRPNDGGCNPGIGYILDTLPLKDAFLLILKGSPECARDTGHFFGLSLPAWTMVGFIGVAIGNLLPWWANKREKRTKS